MACISQVVMESGRKICFLKKKKKDQLKHSITVEEQDNRMRPKFVCVSVVYIRNEAFHRENVKGKAGRETAPNVLDLVVKKVFNIIGTCGWLIEVGGSVREGDHS